MMIEEFIFCCVILKELEIELILLFRILIDNVLDRRYIVESLSYKVVEVYYRFRNKEKMIVVLERLLKLEERTDFLIRKNYIEEVVKMF